jgi:hypothetical protein
MILLTLIPMFPNGHPWSLYAIGVAFVGLGIWSAWTDR